MKLKLGIVPPDGQYFFNERDGTRIEASSWPSLFSLVAGYRTRNGMELGNPVQEVIFQVGERHPELVFVEPQAPIPVGGCA